MRFIRSMSRDIVNMIVCPISNMRDFTPLLTIIQVHSARDLLAIPKTIIFHDGIGGGQRIVAALRTNINPELVKTNDQSALMQMLTDRSTSRRRGNTWRSQVWGFIGNFFVFVAKAIVEAAPNDWESGWNRSRRDG